MESCSIENCKKEFCEEHSFSAEKESQSQTKPKEYINDCWRWKR
jgi:hypothetical protein